MNCPQCKSECAEQPGFDGKGDECTVHFCANCKTNFVPAPAKIVTQTPEKHAVDPQSLSEALG